MINNKNHSQDEIPVSRRGRKGKRPVRRGCLIALGLFAVLAVLAFGVYYFLMPKGSNRPLVLINSPHNGEQLETGQSVTVLASASGDINMTRVELWVNGQLYETETSSLEGGISPFPLFADWLPTSAGAHSLTVRAFNTKGGRAHASINVEVVEGADSGGDLDNDGISNAEDACPEEAGLPELAGCPDRDGDGTSDHLDLCPDQPGPAESGGCPDTGAGDSDGDRVPDDVDLAVDEPGLAAHGGAPAPGMGADDDGDGIPDDEELPDDPLGGLLPGSDIDADLYIPVEVEALNFGVHEEHGSISCYARLADGDMELYGPFSHNIRGSFGDFYSWDIYEVLGGANSIHLMVPNEPLALEVECVAESSGGEDEAVWIAIGSLGSFSHEHQRSEWDGTVRIANGIGTDGRGFQLEYRVCEGACGGIDFPPPVLTSHVNMFGDKIVEWNWTGDRERLAGYHLYANGANIGSLYRNRVSVNASHSSDLAYALYPSCENTVEVYMTAVDDLGRESPPSNTLSLTGEQSCTHYARVTFQSMDINLFDDLSWFKWQFSIMTGGNFDTTFIDSFYAQADWTDNPRIESPYPAGRASIDYTAFFDWMRTEQDAACLSDGDPTCNWDIPAVNYLSFPVNEEERVYIYGWFECFHNVLIMDHFIVDTSNPLAVMTLENPDGERMLVTIEVFEAGS